MCANVFLHGGMREMLIISSSWLFLYCVNNFSGYEAAHEIINVHALIKWWWRFFCDFRLLSSNLFGTPNSGWNTCLPSESRPYAVCMRRLPMSDVIKEGLFVYIPTRQDASADIIRPHDSRRAHFPILILLLPLPLCLRFGVVYKPTEQQGSQRIRL